MHGPHPSATPARRAALPRQPPGLVRTATGAIALAVVVVTVFSRSSSASPTPVPAAPPSILPATLGIAIQTHQALAVDFAEPMDAGSVAAQLSLQPAAAVALSWTSDARHVRVTPRPRWVTDQRYVLTFPATTRLANGSVLGAPVRYAFTTQSAPTITTFGVERVGLDPAEVGRPSLVQSIRGEAPVQLADTLDEASAGTIISIGFSAAMNHAEVERAFTLTPAASGTFEWVGTTLVFRPSARLDPNVRYSLAIVGTHDADGNPLGGDLTFSFTTSSPARVIKVAPADGARGVTTRTVRVWFSKAMDTAATGRAFQLYDASARRAVVGSTGWDTASIELTFTPRTPLALGHTYEIRLGSSSHDRDGNVVAARFTFTSKAPAAPSRTTVAAPIAYPPASSSAAQYALGLINASRKAYGFGPLRLDAALSAVAAAHAWDQVRYGYFSHTGRDGSSPEDRMRAAGITFTHSGENQCEDYGTVTSALQWCHSVMMAEPYPGYWNHIANILNPNFTRLGFGYGRASDGQLIFTWDFAG